ncbi:MAG: histidine kinase dimerization/phospho-acceptor domain-containing protein, partial [Gaiellaceae bacterium]
MHGATDVLRWLSIAAYIALAGVALVSFQRRRDRAAMWAAAAFGSLGLLELLGFAPNHPGNIAERALGRLEIGLLVVFPYLLYRFTIVFRRSRQDLGSALFGLTALLLAWTAALPRIPQNGERWPAVFVAFVVVFLVHWTVLSVLAAWRLIAAGREQPSVARRRMNLLGFASAALTFAIFLAVGAAGAGDPLRLATDVVALLAVVAFYLGLAPPAIVRAYWRMPEQARVQSAFTSLLTFAESEDEVAGRVLEPAAELVGARGIAIRNADGRVVASWHSPDETADVAAVDLVLPGGASLVVWTSPYAPFFGEEELGLLRTLGALTGIALDRVRLFQAEHEARVALERANEVKSNFVALAAHELRTPVTTIHGFVTTLHHLGDKLDEEQRERVREALLQQTQRMAGLVEQLLDLSRLDAEAIDIVPEPLHVRSQV